MRVIYFIRNKIVAEFEQDAIPRDGEAILLNDIDAALSVQYVIWEPENSTVQVHLRDGKGY